MHTSPLPIALFAAALYEHHTALGRADSTVARLKGIVAALYRIGVRTTDDLAADDLVPRILATRPAGESHHTRYGVLSALRTALDFAHREGRIDAIPPLPTIPQPGDRGLPAPRRLLSRPEVLRVLSHMKARADSWEAQRTYVLARVAAATGLLARELLPLRWEDVDFEDQTLRVRPRERFRRSAQPAVVILAPTLLPDLASWRDAADSPWLFPNKTRSGYWHDGPHGSRPVQRIAAAGRDAGVEGLTLDALRRFCLASLSPGLELDGPTIPALAPDVAAAGGEMGKTAAAPIPVKPPRRLEPPATLTTDGATRLLATLRVRSATWEGHREFALFAAALFSGLGRNELFRLEVDAIDDLPAEAREVLVHWLARADGGGTRWAFPGVELRGPWEGGTWSGKPNARLRAVAAELGLGRLTFGCLRDFWKRSGGRVILGREYHETPTPPRILDGPRPKPTGPPPAAGRPPGYLQGPGEPLIIGGKAYGPPTPAQYDALVILALAGGAGLGWAKLEEKSKFGAPRQTLTRFKAADPAYNGVVEFPVRPHGRVRCHLAPPVMLQKFAHGEPRQRSEAGLS